MQDNSAGPLGEGLLGLLYLLSYLEVNTSKNIFVSAWHPVFFFM